MKTTPRRPPPRDGATGTAWHGAAGALRQPSKDWAGTAHRWRSGIVLILLGLALGGGCRRPSTAPEPYEAPGSVAEEAGSQFAQAIDFLNRLDEFESRQAHQQILFRLQQWIQDQAPDPDWVADPMFQRLPTTYEAVRVPDSLSRMRFEPFDVYVLQEAVWLRDIAQTVAARSTPDPSLEHWLADLPPGLSADAAQDLELAARLFDWTVRQVQLDATEPAARPAQAAEAESDQAATQRSEPRLAAGVKFYPWEALLLGHGDWLVRSRIFMLLARQRGLHAVMLAVGGAGDVPPEPWLPAVLLGDSLYLFDMRLGIPVPGPAGRGMATLADLLDDDELLRGLAADGKAYPVTSSRLATITALIDATPADLSQRMKLVESALTGEQKMVLTISPSVLARQLRQCRGIADARIWTLAYDGFEFRRTLAQQPSALAEWFREHRVFEGLSPLAQGRVLQFRGAFDNKASRPGAKNYFLRCRAPDAAIQRLGDSPEAQEAAGLKKALSDQPERRQQLLDETRRAMVQMKQNASYWLGLIAQETGQYPVAIDYFQKRTLDASPDGPWTHGATYNLARCHEALGIGNNDRQHLEAARKLYQEDQNSPQHLGDLIRARRLDELLASLPETSARSASADRTRARAGRAPSR